LPVTAAARVPTALVACESVKVPEPEGSTSPPPAVIAPPDWVIPAPEIDT